MKNMAVGILLTATLVLGGLWLWQTRQATQTQARTDQLRKQVSEQQGRLEAQERQATRLRDQLEEARSEAMASRHTAAPVPGVPPATPPPTSGPAAPPTSGSGETRPSSPLGEMFRNPEMKEMIKNQQKVALHAMIDKNYGSFLSSAALTPEQSSALKDLILNKQLAAADLGMSLIAGESDASKRTELVQQIKAANEAADQEIKTLLGDDRFTQFQAYEQSMAERIAVIGLKDQLGAGPTALTPNQESELVQAMTQERLGFRFTTDLSDQAQLTGDLASVFNEERVKHYFEELGQLNQRYVARAQLMLSPEQVAAFEKYLATQQAMQKAGMQMAAKLLAPPKAGGP